MPFLFDLFNGVGSVGAFSAFTNTFKLSFFSGGAGYAFHPLSVSSRVRCCCVRMSHATLKFSKKIARFKPHFHFGN